jgi:hypothetical protein
MDEYRRGISNAYIKDCDTLYVEDSPNFNLKKWKLLEKVSSKQ